MAPLFFRNSDPEYEYICILYQVWRDDPRRMDVCPVKMSLENVDRLWMKKWRAGHPEKPALPLSAAALRILMEVQARREREGGSTNHGGTVHGGDDDDDRTSVMGSQLASVVTGSRVRTSVMGSQVKTPRMEARSTRPGARSTVSLRTSHSVVTAGMFS
jgi:hypothetical protein